MPWRSPLLAVLLATPALAPAAIAQDPYRPIRFTTADTAGVHRWQGFFEGLTADSLYMRFRDADSISAFSRSAIGSVERQREIHALRGVGIGCLAVGAPLGALGYFGTHDPDSPGLEKIAGVLGFGTGCVAGGIGGLIVSAVRRNGWERWPLPDSVQLRR
jgi:opacity protein-like surface antigen